MFDDYNINMKRVLYVLERFVYTWRKNCGDILAGECVIQLIEYTLRCPISTRGNLTFVKDTVYQLFDYSFGPSISQFKVSSIYFYPTN